MAEKLRMASKSLTEDNIGFIAQRFPNAIVTATENGRIVRKIDFAILQQELSDSLVENGSERFQFTWPDKKASILLSNTRIAASLRPVEEKSVNFDKTSNIYIEGDNLDALKLLRETYLHKVDVIYIDPPYNTGDDHVYDDDFSEHVNQFQKRQGDYDEAGNRLVTNSETSGRFHTDWLNMMYPRLRLCKDFLSEDGTIFVSIDYNENYHLRMIMNEIFGEDHFIGEIYWESKTKSQNTISAYNKLQPKAEMILVYSNDPKKRFNLISRGEKQYGLSDEKGEYREHSLELMNSNGIRGRQTMVFDISDGTNTVSLPPGKQWQIGKEQVDEFVRRNDLFIRDGKVIVKMRPGDERNEQTDPFWGFFGKDIGTAESAKKELISLIGDNRFDTVKPVALLQRLLFHSTKSSSIVLDFFSGSATTAHALMKLNSEDGGKRSFILVQIPELCRNEEGKPSTAYATICDIGEERIRQASKRISEEAGLIGHDFDSGFRVFKVDSSNMREVFYNPQKAVQSLIAEDVSNIKPDRNSLDLLFQVMLELGVELSANIKKIEISGKEVFCVDNNFLVACFDTGVSDEVIKQIAELKPIYVVFRDASFEDDSANINCEQLIKAISPATELKVL